MSSSLHVPVVRRTIELDVRAGLGSAVPCHVSARVVAPGSSMTRPRWLLFCVPGGSYRATYWDFGVSGRSGYSFAEYLAQHGAVVVAVDNLGTGASSRPAPPAQVSIDRIASANASALDRTRSLLKEGLVVPGFGPVELPTVGVGHSLGAFAALIQQEETDQFDALALLGASTQPLSGLPAAAYDRSLPVEQRRREIGRAVSPSAWGVPFEATDSYVTLNRSVYAGRFYRDDVPPDVVEADIRAATVIPREAALDVLVPDRWPGVAAAVGCPVLLAFGDPDLSPDVAAEASAYRRASTVSVLRVPDSAHCHNLAKGRHYLWTAMVAWVERVIGTPSGEVV